MPEVSATAILKGNDITVVAQNGSTFEGKTKKKHNGKSEGSLTYRALPEGDHTFELSITPETNPPTPLADLQITFFFSSPFVQIADPKFVGHFVRDGSFPGDLPGDTKGGDSGLRPIDKEGMGIWKSIDIYQQVYLLSLTSNTIRHEEGSVDELAVTARAKITEVVSKLGWQVVWGPTVWKNDPNHKTGPDHVWFVAKKLGPGKKHIYAISVSASTTIYNYVVNNAGVVQVVDFAAWAAGATPAPTSTIVSTGSYIAFGTAQGVHTLLSHPAPAGAQGAKQTLPDFLKKARGSDSQFIFTGYSLGGTLSPTLALRLAKTDIFTENDDVLAYPIAGASPGNVNFANSFATRFRKTGSSGYKVWNGNVVNSIDVVTNGWSTDTSQSLNLDRIPTKIYGNQPIKSVDWKIDRAKKAANKSGIVYVPLQNTSFTGPTPKPPLNEDEFLAIAYEQHSSAYKAFFFPKPFQSLGSQEVASAEVRASRLEDIAEEDLYPDVDIGI